MAAANVPFTSMGVVEPGGRMPEQVKVPEKPLSLRFATLNEHSPWLEAISTVVPGDGVSVSSMVRKGIWVVFPVPVEGEWSSICISAVGPFHVASTTPPNTAWTAGRFNRMPIMAGNVQDEQTFGIGITEYFSGPPQAPIRRSRSRRSWSLCNLP